MNTELYEEEIGKLRARLAATEAELNATIEAAREFRLGVADLAKTQIDRARVEAEFERLVGGGA